MDGFGNEPFLRHPAFRLDAQRPWQQIADETVYVGGEFHLVAVGTQRKADIEIDRVNAADMDA